jgi:hypothetical protein
VKAACLDSIDRALERVEWVNGRCPWCDRREKYGHASDCDREDARLALAGLRALSEPEDDKRGLR